MRPNPAIKCRSKSHLTPP